MASKPPAARPSHAALQSLALPGMGQRKLGADARGTFQTVLALGSMLLAVLVGYLAAWGVVPEAGWLVMLAAFLVAIATWAWSVFDAYFMALQRLEARRR